MKHNLATAHLHAFAVTCGDLLIIIFSLWFAQGKVTLTSIKTIVHGGHSMIKVLAHNLWVKTSH